jgi:hypothetical protein
LQIKQGKQTEKDKAEDSDHGKDRVCEAPTQNQSDGKYDSQSPTKYLRVPCFRNEQFLLKVGEKRDEDDQTCGDYRMTKSRLAAERLHGRNFQAL